VLFDQGKELRLLTLPEGQYAGSLANATGTSPFTTMALFSPDGKLVLTAGAAEGRMQLWRVPDNGRRGQELVQLIPPERSQPTCGAFASNGQFLVTGSKDRLVHVWTMPTAEEIDEKLEAEVMHIEPAVESGGRQVRIRADIANPNNRLLLGDTVTMVIYPQ
jgi:WD40 repeat protein